MTQKSPKSIPTVLVVFGATGDLMRRKLAPALFHLWEQEKLSGEFRVVGFARRELTVADFQTALAEGLAAYRGRRKPPASFLELFSYVQGYFEEPDDYRKLAKALGRMDEEWGACSHKLFYLAVAPELYRSLLTNLARSGLTIPCGPEGGVTRVLVEKPIGKDAKTAQDLDALLGTLFAEEQIYRVDHYLAKEMLQNILTFRFSNNLLEKNWSNETIEKIEIRLWEQIGAEGRGNFYDSVGALRDVGQNHLLQMLSLVTMDRPPSLNAASIRSKRAEVLHTLQAPTRSEILGSAIRAQYEGYRKIPGVAPDSKTETYFKIHAALGSSRWEGVPVIMESGKRLKEQRKEVVVTFRHPMSCFCPQGVHYRNRVIFALEPEERITIHFWSKKPGFNFEMEPRTFEFLLRETGERIQYVEEYEKLLLDCIAGDQTLFVSTEEVKAMWHFIDPIMRAWHKNEVSLQTYAPDTDTITEEGIGDGIQTKRSTPQSIGLVGLGKMGRNLALQLQEKGWEVHVCDRDERAVQEVARAGIMRYREADAMLEMLERPRVMWLMIPAGREVDTLLFKKGGLGDQLSRGDIVIDGGNSFYQDSQRRAKKLARRGIGFLDVGVSGGPEGARHGASLMVGGENRTYRKLEHLFRDVAKESGYGYVGKSGAGHFVKMVHNGIEYGMMQSIAEGFNMLHAAELRGRKRGAERRGKITFDLKKIAEIYNHGSVIESRLMGWLKKAYEQYGEGLKEVSGAVGHTGEGEWTVKTARRLKIPAPVIKEAFRFRVRSKKKPSYAGKILSVLRGQFGGHEVSAKVKMQKSKVM